MLIHHEAEKITIYVQGNWSSLYGLTVSKRFTLYLYHVPRLMFTVLKTLKVT